MERGARLYDHAQGSIAIFLELDQVPYALTPIGSGVVFFDRDGVIIEDAGYVASVSRLKFIEPVVDRLRYLTHANIPVVIATNQSGIGRGYFSWLQFEILHDFLIEELSRRGVRVGHTIACGEKPDVYHPDGIAWRKPGAGMFLAAKKALGVDLTRSWIVGDKLSDMEAGLRAGLMGGVLIRGKPSGGRNGPWEDAQIVNFSNRFIVEMVSDIRDAALWSNQFLRNL
jgi:D-glycero-D-manno-heptose 1,7-bisphosphate phosphatase